MNSNTKKTGYIVKMSLVNGTMHSFIVKDVGDFVKIVGTRALEGELVHDIDTVSGSLTYINPANICSMQFKEVDGSSADKESLGQKISRNANRF